MYFFSWIIFYYLYYVKFSTSSDKEHIKIISQIAIKKRKKRKRTIKSVWIDPFTNGIMQIYSSCSTDASARWIESTLSLILWIKFQFKILCKKSLNGSLHIYMTFVVSNICAILIEFINGKYHWSTHSLLGTPWNEVDEIPWLLSNDLNHTHERILSQCRIPWREKIKPSEK